MGLGLRGRLASYPPMCRLLTQAKLTGARLTRRRVLHPLDRPMAWRPRLTCRPGADLVIHPVLPGRTVPV